MTTTETAIDWKVREHEWAEALREPGRVQCSGQLGKVKGGEVSEQCCLDVACELAGVPWKLKAPRTVIRFDPDTRSMSESGLTAAAQRWLGVATSDPCIDIPVSAGWRSQGCEEWCRKHSADESCVEPNERLRDLASCATLNDEWGLTFPQIADLVDYFGLVRS